MRSDIPGDVAKRMKDIFKNELVRLAQEDSAATMTEYGLLIAAVGAGVFAASAALSDSIITFFQSTASTLGDPG